MDRCEYYLYFANFDYKNRNNETNLEILYSEQLNRDDTEIDIELDLSEIQKEKVTCFKKRE